MCRAALSVSKARGKETKRGLGPIGSWFPIPKSSAAVERKRKPAVLHESGHREE